MTDTSRLSAALAGRYRIERVIGRGGMATVYLADDLRHRRKVAIKLLEPELAYAVGAERFLREIEIAAGLSHPHIVPLFDSGDADGQLFYVMPFLEGESLRDRIDRERYLPIDDAVSIARQVASALDYAHARNVIHRDIKPENVLVYEGEAMVADFGIALAASAAATRRITGTGLVVGTPEYMSPEQALDEGVDGRSDQYSLACVLFELLAGEPPYSGPSPTSIIAKRLMDPVPSVRRLRNTVPTPVDEAIARALSKVPADRFATAGEFATALTAPAPARPRATSVAVLPFRSLSVDPENEYFADGITEDVIAHLSKIRALKVISRNSVMPFKQRTQSLREIGATLGATALLDGSVRRAGDRVRIVAQLVDSETDRHLWVETYDRKLDDIFAIQTDVALHIAEALKAELSGEEQTRVRKEPTHDLQAYQLFLQGRQWYIRYTPESIEQSIDYYDRAVARDPTFALALANMSMSYIELAEHGAMEPDLAHPRAESAVAEALRIDPELGAAHCTMAYLRTVRDYDWENAEAEFKRAIELSPSYGDAYDLYGRLCSALERYDEALQLLQRAQELDPLAHRIDVATMLIRAGRYEDAIARARDATDVDPSHARAWATLGWAKFLNGRHADGVADLERAVSASPGNSLWLAQLGEGYGLAGDHTKARDVLRQIKELSRREYVSPYQLVYVHVGLGEFDRALDLLERAVAERSGPAYAIKGSFLLKPLRFQPRFQALLREMRLA
ncbi:MAG: protein kinase [Gemmatimonadetes bacterium]|nr:protein kinase [Gemmatimonadota bacterium]